ncbi:MULTISPECIES: hypothetical protein [Pseudomonas]|uniref:Uncharacterized protein n=1 Tax=Pseudomonas gingeri TaxID=117681 RepID=A0A7Y8BN57_9PSED|nr:MULTISPECIES: hypothetical protein [Pseudomonas]MCU1738048.1 hypothetical protein [Pseudomonas sp. 20S_6.2_Bac1]NWB49333.1 hypothetical protein [Pseudomonas gingeri]
MTFRIRADFLTRDEAGKFLFEGTAFSGLAYRVGEDSVLTEIVSVDAGLVEGPSADWLTLPAGGKRVERRSLKMDEDYGPELYQGLAFTGIAYSFTASGRCFAELEYLNGFVSDENRREWYASGEPKALAAGDETTTWFENGRLMSKQIGDDETYGVRIGRDGCWWGLVLLDGALLDLDQLGGLTSAEEMLLAGAAITSQVLVKLKALTTISTCRRLRLFETGIDATAVDVLVSFGQLEEIWLDRNPGLGPEAARQLELRKPGCVVHVEVDPE